MTVRIDKWLWVVRIFKTRTEAAEACKKGRIFVNEIQTKPSKELKKGDTVTVKRAPVNYVYRVLELAENRQPAKNVELYARNITPVEDLEQAEARQSDFFVRRDRGAGRPTKKERREIDRFSDFILDEDGQQ